jgi:hypothetical protein
MEKILDKMFKYFGTYKIGVLDAEDDVLWTVEPVLKNIRYLKAENAMGRHIFIQPVDEPCFLMADDLKWQRVVSDHKSGDGWRLGRMCVETSPENFQVWIRTNRPLSIDEKKHWLNRLGSDPDAGPRGRWGRCPGFRNRKDKYQNDLGWPLSKLIWVDYRNLACIPVVTAPMVTTRNTFSPSTPRRGACHSLTRDIHRSHYDRGNDSRTDFAYVMALLRRGYSDQVIRQRILDERSQWQKHRDPEKYVERTIRKARAFCETASC